MGRKPLIEEIKVRNLCIAAIEEKYGSVQQGLIALLESGEVTLMKFVFEHAIGKPKESISIDAMQTIETIQIIQLPDNGRDPNLVVNLPGPMSRIEDAQIVNETQPNATELH